MPSEYKSGIVTIIGRPSAGKSTFLNVVCGGKVSIVSAMPQTTRNAIRGIVSLEAGQIVFIDTPGLHNSEKKFNLRLRTVSTENLKETDAILYIIDSTRSVGEEEEFIFDLLSTFQEKLCIAINKIDDKKSQTGVLKLSLKTAFPDLPDNRILEISAKTGENKDTVLSTLIKMLPEGPELYPTDFYTDQEVRFRITEIIREQAILNTREEIPHAIYVKIDDISLKRNGKELFARAFIYVERESQKGMLIGKNAKLIRKIKENSLAQLRKIFSYHINLNLQVRVDKNWRQNSKKINFVTGG
ncbi:MAG: GTPase Era [Treponema sp.]|nr:MAG: GTPase Era [Treponema sp.]